MVGVIGLQRWPFLGKTPIRPWSTMGPSEVPSCGVKPAERPQPGLQHGSPEHPTDNPHFWSWETMRIIDNMWFFADMSHHFRKVYRYISWELAAAGTMGQKPGLWWRMPEISTEISTDHRNMASSKHLLRLVNLMGPNSSTDLKRYQEH